MNSFRKKPIVTYGLIAVNLLVFIGMTLSGGSQNVVNLIAWGAKYNPLIIQGELWRLFTPMFIHIGLEHFSRGKYFAVWFFWRLFDAGRII